MQRSRRSFCRGRRLDGGSPSVIAPLPPAGSSPPGATDTTAGTNSPAERRHLTILFCDMVASTEYANRLDPEDFRRLMESFLATCSAVARRHKGVVASY